MMTAPESDTDAVPTHTLHLVATLFAEEHILLDWSENTNHPRLETAYRSLQARIGERCKSVRDAWEAAYPDARRAVLDATLDAHEQHRRTTFELSRLKWLLAVRRERLNHEHIPGYEAYRATEEEEEELLGAIMHDLARGLC